MMKCFLTLVVVIGLCGHRALGASLLQNGSFEQRDAQMRDLPASWTEQASAGDIALEFTGEHYEGATAALIPGDNKPHAWRQTIVAPTDRSFTLSGMIKAEAAAMDRDGYAFIYGHILYKGRPYADATHFYAKIPPGTYDWRKVSVSGVANRNEPIEKVTVTVTGRLTGGRIMVDQVDLSPDASATPDALLANKVKDLLTQLDRVGPVNETINKSRTHLTAAAVLLMANPGKLPEAADEWVQAVSVLDTAAWTAIFPDAMSDKPVEAHMIYHGQAATKEGCDRNLDLISKAGANAVYLSLGSWMSVTYPSDLIPTAPDFAADDTLKYFIEQAHKRGIKVFGYVAAFYGTHEPPTDANSIYAKHPDWFAKGPDANMPTFPDPANSQAAEFIVKVYSELAAKYDLDGIGLDYIRYPTETALNFDENNRKRILDLCGVDISVGEVWKDPAKWEKIVDYRASNTRNVITQVRDAVQKARPGTTLIGCLISNPDEARLYGQNWAKSSVLLDYATPMNYDDTSADEKLLDRQRDTFVGNKARFIAAIGGMPEVHHSWTISTWAKRVAMQRKVGCDGIILYRLGDLDPAVAAFFGNGPFHNKSTFPDPIGK